MFILVQFGYKQSRIFTIDCLTSTLIDCIWANCIKDINKNLTSKEELFTKTIGDIHKKISSNEKKLTELKEEEAKKNPDA